MQQKVHLRLVPIWDKSLLFCQSVYPRWRVLRISCSLLLFGSDPPIGFGLPKIRRATRTSTASNSFWSHDRWGKFPCRLVCPLPLLALTHCQDWRCDYSAFSGSLEVLNNNLPSITVQHINLSSDIVTNPVYVHNHLTRRLGTAFRIWVGGWC